LLASLLIALLPFEANALVFTVQMIPEQPDDSRELCAFSLLLPVQRQATGLKLLIWILGFLFFKSL
jgi:hypothetical protein